MSDLFTYAKHYPQQPGFKARDTAVAAADAMVSKVPRLRRMCLDHLRSYGELTADETARALRIDKLSIRPRFSELASLGQIEDTGARRLNASGKKAVVWRLVAQRLAA